MDRVVIDTEGASLKLAAQGGPLPGNVISFILCPLAPRGRSLRNTFRPEALGCGDDQIVVALIGITNQGLVRVWDSFRDYQIGGRPAFAEAASRRQA